MPHNTDRAADLAPVAPLRMRRPDDSLYCRPNEVEALLATMLRLPPQELVERGCIDDPDDSRYVPSECLLYFVRRPVFGIDEEALRSLFVVMRQRVLRAVPVSTRRIPGSTKVAECSIDLEIRDTVLHKFQEMLCGDRREYDERLDYYECRFNSALASLRATARRDVRREESHHEPLGSESEPNEPSAEVEAALAAIRLSPGADSTDFLFRSKLLVVISSLPQDERRVIELILEEIPIDSKDPEVQTIAKILGCTEKTVRNRRDRAFARLREALKEEDT